MEYKTILGNVLTAREIAITHGNSIFVIFDDEVHLQEWIELSDDSKDVKIITIPTKHYNIFEVADIDNVAVLSLGLGTKDDLSDVVSIYHLVVKNK